MTSELGIFFRIISVSEWIAASPRGIIPRRAADRQSGYYHLSTADQLFETATRHYADENDLLVLCFPEAALDDRIKWELAPKRADWFPHYYGALKADQVIEVFLLLRDEEGWFLADIDEAA